MPPSLTVYFIVEPPRYEVMACYLAASIKDQFGDGVVLVGYCPKHRLADIHPDVRQALALLDVDLRGFVTDGRFVPAYPHGNKLLASLEPRDTEFSCFMDSDILCIRPNLIENITQPGHVSVSKAASLNWAPESIWDDIYGICRMEQPAERFKLMKQRKGQPRMPYFSSGFVSFPEHHRNSEGLRFPEVWMQIAQRLDADPDLPRKRPYLDQMSLPLAIRKAGLDWNVLPDEQHFILGGNDRGKPLSQDRDIYTIHYRIWDIVKEVGLARQAKDMLERQVGVRRLAQLSSKPVLEDQGG